MENPGELVVESTGDLVGEGDLTGEAPGDAAGYAGGESEFAGGGDIPGIGKIEDEAGAEVTDEVEHGLGSPVTSPCRGLVLQYREVAGHQHAACCAHCCALP